MLYDASMHFLSHGHLPYAVLALFMLTMFCGLPFLVLCLHPMACFQRCLDKLRSRLLFFSVCVRTQMLTLAVIEITLTLEWTAATLLPAIFLFRFIFLGFISLCSTSTCGCRLFCSHSPSTLLFSLSERNGSTLLTLLASYLLL